MFAHPDDDTYSVGGTVALHDNDPAFRFVLVHATSGEAGQIADPSLATPETLGEVREEEDRRSWRTLGREPDRHEWLRYPDGGVAEAPFDELVERIATVLQEELPDVVVTFGPDGVTAHPDHITVGRATTEAFHRIRSEGDGGLHRLVYVAIPQAVIEAWNAALVAAGKEPFDPTQVFHPRGVPDEAVGVDVDCRSVAHRVVAALEEHRTQAAEMDEMSEEERLATVAHEHGVIAWPHWAPGDPMLHDLFDGIR